MASSDSSFDNINGARGGSSSPASGPSRPRHGAKSTAPAPAYYSPSQRRIRNLDFNESHVNARRSDIDKLAADKLIGASAIDTATYKAKHIETDVFGELDSSIRTIEEKFHAGMYDAQALPLVEAFIDELEQLAMIQLDRNEVNDCRIDDIKQANAAAYRVVCDAREKRELSIDAVRLARLDALAPDFDQLEEENKSKREKRMRVRDARHTKRKERKERRLKKRIEASKRREENRSSRQNSREAKREQRAARMERKQAMLLEREQARLDTEKEKQRVIAQEAQQRMEELKRKEEEARAQSLLKQAQAEAEAERAKVDAQNFRVEAEKARIEEVAARAEREAAEQEAKLAAQRAVGAQVQQDDDVCDSEQPDETQNSESKLEQKPNGAQSGESFDEAQAGDVLPSEEQSDDAQPGDERPDDAQPDDGEAVEKENCEKSNDDEKGV